MPRRPSARGCEPRSPVPTATTPRPCRPAPAWARAWTGKDGKNYWLNDITSHIYDVPRKDNKGVKGVEPGKAMPIPYTNKCGAACHDTFNAGAGPDQAASRAGL
jgi:hypothetical protein